MQQLRLTMDCGRYDRTQALIDGVQTACRNIQDREYHVASWHGRSGT